MKFLGKILAVILLALSVLLMVQLNQLHILPTDLMVALGLVLVLITALVLVLTWPSQKKVWMIIGSGLALITIAGLVVGNVYIHKTPKTVSNITGTEIELVRVGVYVRAEDAEQFDDMAPDCQYGILRELDRESTKEAIAQMEKALDTKLACQAYERPTELVDALLNSEVDAIVLNTAFIEVLQEQEGYEDLLERICEVEVRQISVEIETPALPTLPNKPGNNSALQPFGIYISGIDTYGTVAARSRSNVNILAIVNPNTHRILLVSTPRDYYVPLSISNGIPDKLTHAGIYGVDVSRDTLGMLYGIDMDYYFWVNFSGFKEIVDALGGITVYSEVGFRRGNHYYSQGENYLNGELALGFCRERYAFSSGDRQRGKNQMAVIKAIIDKATSPTLLANYTEILKAMEGCFETNMHMELIGSLVASQLQDGGTWQIDSYSVDGFGDSQIPYSMSQYAYVMQPDYSTVEKAKELIQSVLDRG